MIYEHVLKLISTMQEDCRLEERDWTIDIYLSGLLARLLNAFIPVYSYYQYIHWKMQFVQVFYNNISPGVLL